MTTATKQGHTPGPWIFEGQGGYERKRADGSPWRSLNVGLANGTTIAEVCVPNGGTWADPEAIANRDLIAAAPELLEQVEAFERFATIAAEGRVFNQDQIKEAMSFVLPSIRAAIARATGQGGEL